MFDVRLFAGGVKKTEVVRMNEASCDKETKQLVFGGVVVPESALLRRERGNKYGSVPGLADSELADPEELERQVMRSELGPVLALPVRGRQSGIRAAIDECGGIDWGAFGTVDFDRSRPELDKARYKADRLREQLKDIMIMVGIISTKLPGKAKYLVLRYLKMRLVEMEHIVNPDMQVLARLQARADGLRRQIVQLGQVSHRRQEQRLEAWLKV